MDLTKALIEDRNRISVTGRTNTLSIQIKILVSMVYKRINKSRVIHSTGI